MKANPHDHEESGCFCQTCTCILAMATVPMQSFGPVYEPEKALMIGTIFADLDLPFHEGGEPNV